MNKADQQKLKRPRAYLAGPEVFLDDAVAIAEQKQAICDRHGLTGVSPLDTDLKDVPAERVARALGIYRGNLDLMDSCALIIANVTPFRGPGADAGTAFEMGYMAARQKPVFAYTNAPADYRDRVAAQVGVDLVPRASDGRPADPDGLSVEDFGLADNLMLEAAVRAHCAGVIRAESAPADPYRDLVAFEACVKDVVKTLRLVG